MRQSKTNGYFELFIDELEELPAIDYSITDLTEQKRKYNELLKQKIYALMYKNGITCTVTFRWTDELANCTKLRGYCVAKKTSNLKGPKEHDREFVALVRKKSVVVKATILDEIQHKHITPRYLKGQARLVLT